MPSLLELFDRAPGVRARSFGLSVAPFISERVGSFPIRHVEDAAITVLASVFQRSGPLREQLVFERPRFERIVQAIHRCPDRRGGG